MAGFKRGIRKPGMMDALAELAARPSWWRDVLQDERLIIGVRDNYLNVYWHGQSIFKVEMKKERGIVATTHPKYLLNPDLKRQIALDPSTSEFRFDPTLLLTHRYVPGETLEKLKKAAQRYAGKEKRGVQEIAEANTNLVDVEIAFREDAEGRRVPRIDFATFEERASRIELVFWEAKLFGNAELSDNEDKGVIAQIKGYDRFLIQNRDEITTNYQIIAKDISRIVEMSDRARSLSPAIRRIADGETLHLTKPDDVRLVVFGFTEQQRDGILMPLFTRLEKHLGSGRFLARGKSSGMRLKL
ncbi:hypothetical protein [Xanthobacter sp. YC-JY1]|uniref:hypothetical protein n=1 Tax=Xanthobacter sp. YC-JY1 TaxID=2419844 RepID=UPI001F353E05|nr:hypothetical protein [Xanthobacter sp. YC-JY1]UJX46670.1 hypothetical protein D7006_19485 [Xanthobacter sp. YC-JY1]